MENRAGTMRIVFGPLRAVNTTGEVRRNALTLDIEAEWLEIELNGRLWYREVDFPVIEFAGQLVPWFAPVRHGDIFDFAYEPTGYAAEMISLHYSRNGFQVVSPGDYAEFVFSGRIPVEETVKALESFVHTTAVQVLQKFEPTHPWIRGRVERWLAC